MERIRSLTVTDHPFQLPLNFDLEAYVRDTIGVMRGQPSTVELVLDKTTAAWAKDRIWHPSQQLIPQKGGQLRLTLKVAVTPELVGWVLSFGGGATVLQPAELKEAVHAAAERILART